MFVRAARILGLVLLGVAFVLTCALAGGLVFGWWRVLPVQSGSMAPAIPKGAAVVVTPHSFDELRVGQIIVYDPPTPGTGLLVHRVVDIQRNGDVVTVQTRGDANDANDPWMAELSNPPIWRVERVFPHAGTAVDLLRNRALRIALFPLALLGLMLAALATVAQLPSVAGQVARPDHDPAKDRAAPDAVADEVVPPVEVPAAAAARSMTTVNATLLRTHRPSSLRSALAAAGVAVDAPLVDERPLVGATVRPAAAPTVTAEPAATPTVTVGPAATPTVTVTAEPVAAPAPEARRAPLLVATPPDWYRDPTGRFDHRWFDGERWTDQVAQQGERRTDPLR